VPANGARDVSPATRITFNFNERLDPATVNNTTFTVTLTVRSDLGQTASVSKTVTVLPPDD
jgi:hypothetical protein